MKRLMMVLAAGAFLLTVTASCEKCSTCIVKETDGTVIYDYAETCGNKDVIDDYKNQCEAQYGSFGFDCACSDD